MIRSVKRGLAPRFLAIAAVAAVSSLATACSNDGAKNSEAVLTASVTIYPAEYFTKEVGGDRVAVQLIIPVGTDAHDFEPTPGDIRTINESDLVVFNHPAFEGWIASAIAVARPGVEFVQLADLPEGIEFIDDHGNEDGHDHDGEDTLAELVDHAIHEYLEGEIDFDEAIAEIQELLDEHGDDDPEFAVEIRSIIEAFGGGQLTADDALDDLHHVAVEHLGEGMDQHDHDDDEHEGAVDPHVWLNPIDAIGMVSRIRDSLSRLDPAGAAIYANNAAALVERLTELDNEFNAGLQSCQRTVFVASHLAYGHLSERYGLEQLGLSGLSDEAEPGPQHIAQTIDRMRELGLTTVLVEPLSNQALAETVARETGAQLLPLHPLESLLRSEVEAGDDYFTVMRRNLESLRTALDCSG